MVYGVPPEYNKVNETVTLQRIGQLLDLAGFSANDVQSMAAIAWRESRFNSHARNPASIKARQPDGRIAAGLYQNMTSLSEEKTVAAHFYDPWTSTKMARSKFVASRDAGFSGFRPWGLTDDGAHSLAMPDGSKQNLDNPWVPDKVEGAADAVSGAVDAVKDIPTQIKDFVITYSFAVGIFFVGAAIVIIGIWLLIGDTKIGKTATGLVETFAAPEAKLAAGVAGKGRSRLPSVVT